MEPEEALHFHILRRKKEGVEDWIDQQRREDRRRPDAQRRAAAGDEGGRRQVRRRRADPAVRAPVGRGDEARGRPARAVPRQDRGLHEGHRRDRDRVRRRARHRQVAGQHDPHQQRLHGRRPRQAGPDLDHPRRRRRARGDRDRPQRAARLDLQADARLRPGAPRARARVPGAGRRRRDQPQLRPADPVPERHRLRRRLRARRLLLQGRVRGAREDGRADRRRGARGAGREDARRGARAARAARGEGRRRARRRPTPRSAAPRRPTTRSRSPRSGAPARSRSTWTQVYHHLDTHVLFKLHWGGRGVKGEEWQRLLKGDPETGDFQPRLERMWREQDLPAPARACSATSPATPRATS